MVLLVAVSVGLLGVEYELMMWLGLKLLLIAGCGLTTIAVALSRAPQGCDAHDALHICRSPRRPLRVFQPRFSQIIRARL